jgi:DNA-binding MarR family transcriptional regulator
MSSNLGATLVPDVIATLRALSAALDRLDEVAARRYGLNRTDMRALDIIGRVGPLAPTELAHELGFTTGGVTTVIDRLERSGYANRRPHETDRRRLVVEATETTRERDRAVFADLARLTADLVGSYEERDLRVIQDFLERQCEVTNAYSEGLAAAAEAVVNG